jgi:GYF domain 2
MGRSSNAQEPPEEPDQFGDVWYYADRGAQVGPLTGKELKRTLATIPNAKQIYVWRDGMPDWQRAGDIPDLFPRSAPKLPPPYPVAGTKRFVRREIRKRGFFGKLIKFLFIVFNLLMIVWLASYWAQIGELVNQTQSEAGKTGAAIGVTIGTGFILFFWVAGDVILGLLTLLTRGSVIVEEITQ